MSGWAGAQAGVPVETSERTEREDGSAHRGAGLHTRDATAPQPDGVRACSRDDGRRERGSERHRGEEADREVRGCQAKDSGGPRRGSDRRSAAHRRPTRATATGTW